MSEDEWKTDVGKLHKDIQELKSELRILANKMPDLEDNIRMDERLKVVEAKIDNKVSIADFKPVRMVVYGLIGIVLTSVGGGLISLIIK